MNCPGCSAEMTDLSSEGEQVRACPECGGLWSELAELNRLLLHHNLPGVDSLGGRIDREASSPTCPECQIDMICVQSRDRKSGLQYDTCESCGGAFVDDGFEPSATLPKAHGLIVGFFSRFAGKKK